MLEHKVIQKKCHRETNNVDRDNVVRRLVYQPKKHRYDDPC